MLNKDIEIISDALDHQSALIGGKIANFLSVNDYYYKYNEENLIKVIEISSVMKDHLNAIDADMKLQLHEVKEDLEDIEFKTQSEIKRIDNEVTIQIQQCEHDM